MSMGVEVEAHRPASPSRRLRAARTPPPCTFEPCCGSRRVCEYVYRTVQNGRFSSCMASHAGQRRTVLARAAYAQPDPIVAENAESGLTFEFVFTSGSRQTVDELQSDVMHMWSRAWDGILRVSYATELASSAQNVCAPLPASGGSSSKTPFHVA